MHRFKVQDSPLHLAFPIDRDLRFARLESGFPNPKSESCYPKY